MDHTRDMDRMSEASFGSVISLHSIGSDGISYSPRPPAGPRKRKPVEEKRSKTQKISPYAQTISPKPLPKQPKRPSGRELWVSAIRQGRGYSSESTGMDSWNVIRPSHAKGSPGLSSASNFLIEQLLQSTDALPKKHVRSSSTGLARVGGNGPKYKTAEEYYDEILELKKIINGLRADNDSLKSKLVKLENDNNVKGKRIEELLNPNKQTNEMRRTLADAKKAQSSSVVASLKQQQSVLERSLKARDEELRNLRNELKSTSIEEAKIQAEVYYQEVQRLKQSQADLPSKSSTLLTKDINAEKTPEGKLKKMHEAIKLLSDDKQRLVQENMSLKQDLAKSLEAHVNGVNLSKEVEDMSRSELLTKICAIEQKLQLVEKKEEEEKDDTDIQGGQIKLQGPLSQQLKQLRAREKELLKENEALKETVQRLKEDRLHYRKIADDLRYEADHHRASLDETGSVVTMTHQLDVGPRERSASKRVKEERLLSKKRSFSNDGDNRLHEIQQNEAARRIQRNWRRRRGYTDRLVDQEEGEPVADADGFEDSILMLQAAFRGNQARHNYYNSQRQAIQEEKAPQENLSDTEDIILLQSAFRGHLSRQDVIQKAQLHHRSSSSDFRSAVEPDSDEDNGSRPPLRTFRSRTTGSLISIQDTADDSSIYGDDEEYLRQARLRYDGKRDVKSRADSLSCNLSRSTKLYEDINELSRFRSRSNELSDSSASRQKFRTSITKGKDYEDVSVNHLKASSNPWSKGQSNTRSITDDVESDDDHVMIRDLRRAEGTSGRRKSSNAGSSHMAEMWAQNGRNPSKDSSMKRNSRVSNPTSPLVEDDDHEDDDDDIVISPAIARRPPRTSQPKEELF